MAGGACRRVPYGRTGAAAGPLEGLRTHPGSIGGLRGGSGAKLALNGGAPVTVGRTPHKVLFVMRRRTMPCATFFAAAIMAGCASAPSIPPGATRIATGVMPGATVTVPTGTREVYFVQRGPRSQTVGSMKLGATTQPAHVPVLMFLGSSKRAVDVYVTSEAGAGLPATVPSHNAPLERTGHTR